jgi:hypothetical protein
MSFPPSQPASSSKALTHPKVPQRDLKLAVSENTPSSPEKAASELESVSAVTSEQLGSGADADPSHNQDEDTEGM